MALPVGVSPALLCHSPLLEMHVRQDNPSPNSCRRNRKEPTPSEPAPSEPTPSTTAPTTGLAPVCSTTLTAKASICDTDTSEMETRDRDGTDGLEAATATAPHRPFCLIFNRKWRRNGTQPLVFALAHVHVGYRRWDRGPDPDRKIDWVLEGWVCRSPSLASLDITRTERRPLCN